MGFFDNIFDGIKSAGSWALDHSGDIAGVIDTVAQIAGVLDPASVRSPNDEISNLANYQENFAKVSDHLVTAAKAAATAAASSSSSTVIEPSDSSQTVDDYITGIWKDPAPLTTQNFPTQSMYNDLSKLIGGMNIPPTIVSPDGKVNDTASLIGAALFANTSVKSKGDGPVSPFTSTAFNITDKSGTSSIVAGHAYYSLPMGKQAVEDVLHTCVYVKHIMTDTAYQANLQRIAVYTIRNAIPNEVDGWLVTMNITWNNASQAEDVQTLFLSNLATLYPTIKITANAVNGVSQLLKVWAPASTAPGTVRKDVADVVSTSMQSLPQFASSLPSPSSTAPMNYFSLCSPVVVTDSSFGALPSSAARRH